MILVDSSVWRFAVRRHVPRSGPDVSRWREAQALPALLDRGLVVGHLWIQIELRLGGLPSAEDALYGRLPRTRPLGVQSLLEFVEASRPRGIGLVDLGLLVAAIRDGLGLWTLDDGLREAARDHKVAWFPAP